MPSNDLTPQYLTAEQLSQLLVPQYSVGSNLAIPVDLAQLQKLIAAQQLDATNTGQQPTNPVQTYASGGKVSKRAENNRALNFMRTPTWAELTREDIINIAQRDPHLQKLFGIPAAEDLAENPAEPHPTPIRKPSIPSQGYVTLPPKPEVPYEEDIEGVLSQYGTDAGKDYMRDREKISGGISGAIDLHDVVSGIVGNGAVRRAEGGRVGNNDKVVPVKKASGGLIHKFKNHVTAVKPIKTTHYRDSMGNDDLSKLRSKMRIR